MLNYIFSSVLSGFGECFGLGWVSIRGSCQKQVYLVHLEPKTGTRYILKSSKKTHNTRPAIGQRNPSPVLPDKAQVQPSCLLCLTFNCFLPFLLFLDSQRSSIVPSYAPYTNAVMVRGDIYPPRPAPRVMHHATPAIT